MPEEIRVAKIKYRHQRATARQRGLQMKLTFQEWYQWWQETGHWNERGKGGYVMSRFNDQGDYELGNIFCQRDAENSREAGVKKKGIPKVETGKLFKTIQGTFLTRAEAARAHGLSYDKMVYLCKIKPNDYYFL